MAVWGAAGELKMNSRTVDQELKSLGANIVDPLEKALDYGSSP
jgi:hypothetical protein